MVIFCGRAPTPQPPTAFEPARGFVVGSSLAGFRYRVRVLAR